MDEKEAPKEEQTSANAGEGDKPKAVDVIGDANAAAERLEVANKEKERLLNEEKEMIAKRTLGGDTSAGVQSETQKEQTAKEYADEVLAGKHNG